MICSSILDAVFRHRADRRSGRKREAFVHSYGSPIPDENHHYEGLKTTYDVTGTVRVDDMEGVATAWAVSADLPDDCEWGRMDGIWLAFKHDTCFRAGEGVWLKPKSFFFTPQIRIQYGGR